MLRERFSPRSIALQENEARCLRSASTMRRAFPALCFFHRSLRKTSAPCNGKRRRSGKTLMRERSARHSAGSREKVGVAQENRLETAAPDLWVTANCLSLGRPSRTEGRSQGDDARALAPTGMACFFNFRYSVLRLTPSSTRDFAHVAAARCDRVLQHVALRAGKRALRHIRSVRRRRRRSRARSVLRAATGIASTRNPHPLAHFARQIAHAHDTVLADGERGANDVA